MQPTRLRVGKGLCEARAQRLGGLVLGQVELVAARLGGGEGTPRMLRQHLASMTGGRVTMGMLHGESERSGGHGQEDADIEDREWG